MSRRCLLSRVLLRYPLVLKEASILRVIGIPYLLHLERKENKDRIEHAPKILIVLNISFALAAVSLLFGMLSVDDVSVGRSRLRE